MKKTKLAILSGLACCAVVGSGFAAWVFSGDASSESQLGVSIATSSTSGNVEITGDTVLNIDQTGMTWNDFDVKATYTGGANSSEGASGTVIRTYTVSLDTNLSKYLEITAGASGTWTDGTVITSPTVEWKEGMNPDNKTEYDTMVSEITNSKITFSFSADWTDTDSIN